MSSRRKQSVKPSITMRLTSDCVVWFVCVAGPGMWESVGLTGLYQLCVYWCAVEQIGFHCLVGWLVLYSTVKCWHTLVVLSPFLSLPLHSNSLFFTFFQSPPPPPPLSHLHNAQLYLLQLKSVISPSRLCVSKPGEQRRDAADLSDPPVCTAPLT